jgi:hypothetical protein
MKIFHHENTKVEKHEMFKIGFVMSFFRDFVILLFNPFPANVIQDAGRGGLTKASPEISWEPS